MMYYHDTLTHYDSIFLPKISYIFIATQTDINKFIVKKTTIKFKNLFKNVRKKKRSFINTCSGGAKRRRLFSLIIETTNSVSTFW